MQHKWPSRRASAQAKQPNETAASKLNLQALLNTATGPAHHAPHPQLAHLVLRLRLLLFHQSFPEGFPVVLALLGLFS